MRNSLIAGIFSILLLGLINSCSNSTDDDLFSPIPPYRPVINIVFNDTAKIFKYPKITAELAFNNSVVDITAKDSVYKLNIKSPLKLGTFQMNIGNGGTCTVNMNKLNDNSFVYAGFNGTLTVTEIQTDSRAISGTFDVFGASDFSDFRKFKMTGTFTNVPY
ncbi:MAG: hypothetical protein ACOVMN_09285 [Flexibacteraceae bacterium]